MSKINIFYDYCGGPSIGTTSVLSVIAFGFGLGLGVGVAVTVVSVIELPGGPETITPPPLLIFVFVPGALFEIGVLLFAFVLVFELWCGTPGASYTV